MSLVLDMDDILGVLPAAKWSPEKVAAEADRVVASFANTWCREQRWVEVSADQLDVIAAHAETGVSRGSRDAVSYQEVADHAAHVARLKREGRFHDMPCDSYGFMAECRRRGLSLDEAIVLYGERFPAGLGRVYQASPRWFMEEQYNSGN